MAEYIDKEKAKGILIALKNECWKSRVNPNQITGIVYSINELNKVPTADVQEVKHGEWLPDYETFTDYNGYDSEPIQTGWVCSVCGRQEPRKELYCHCGALMSNYEDEQKGEDNVRV